MLKIYTVQRTYKGKVSVDDPWGAVVVAITPTRAIEFSGLEDYAENDNSLLSVNEIGFANIDQPEGVVVEY